jgi:hypothetical protein
MENPLIFKKKKRYTHSNSKFKKNQKEILKLF